MTLCHLSFCVYTNFIKEVINLIKKNILDSEKNLNNELERSSSTA